MKHTLKEIAEDFDLFRDYMDPSNPVCKAEFDDMGLKVRFALVRKMFSNKVTA